MMNYRRLAIFVALCLPFKGFAAGINCEKSVTEIEKLICADQELLLQDDRLDVIYWTLQEDNPNFNFYRTRLRQEQREWLKTRDLECKSLDKVKLKYCLEEQYQQRITVLSSLLDAPIYIKSNDGNYDIPFTASIYTDSDGVCHNNKLLQRKSLNRLLNFDPESMELMVKYKKPSPNSVADECPTPTFETTNITYTESMNYVSDNLVSLELYSIANSGGSHPDFDRTLLSLDRAKHSLISWNDMFGENTSFEEYVYQRVYDEIADQEYSYGAIEQFKDLGYFNIRQNGLFIQYDNYDIGTYSHGEPSLTIPLKILKKYMNRKKYQYYFGESQSSKMAIKH